MSEIWSEGSLGHVLEGVCLFNTDSSPSMTVHTKIAYVGRRRGRESRSCSANSIGGREALINSRGEPNNDGHSLTILRIIPASNDGALFLTPFVQTVYE